MIASFSENVLPWALARGTRTPHADRSTLRRLWVFVGGFDAAAAPRVAGFAPLDEASVPGLLADLVAKSLVQLEVADTAGRMRWRLLETVRAFARDRCGEAEESGTVEDRHLQWATELAEAREPATARCDIAALDELERELPDLRRALDHAARQPAGSTGLRLVAALAFFWARRGLGIPGAPLGEEVIAAAGRAGPRQLPRAGPVVMAYARFYGGAFPEAAAAASAALADAGESGDLGHRRRGRTPCSRGCGTSPIRTVPASCCSRRSRRRSRSRTRPPRTRSSA